MIRGHPVPELIRAGEESVWDYPRPPRLEPSTARIEVILGGEVIASTCAEVHREVLDTPGRVAWKRSKRRGASRNRRVTSLRSAGTSRSTPAASTNAASTASSSSPQPGEFYGGWITAKIKGPFKGLPGTMGW